MEVLIFIHNSYKATKHICFYKMSLRVYTTGKKVRYTIYMTMCITKWLCSIIAICIVTDCVTKNILSLVGDSPMVYPRLVMHKKLTRLVTMKCVRALIMNWVDIRWHYYLTIWSYLMSLVSVYFDRYICFFIFSGRSATWLCNSYNSVQFTAHGRNIGCPARLQVSYLLTGTTRVIQV